MSAEPIYNKSMSSLALGQNGRKLIVSVDDQLGVLYSRYKLLSAAGYAVLSATDGVQALQIFGNNKVDLVLLDFMLQGRDGGLVADAMKAHSPNVPILMASAVEVPEDCFSKVNGFVRKVGGPRFLVEVDSRANRCEADETRPQTSGILNFLARTLFQLLCLEIAPRRFCLSRARGVFCQPAGETTPSLEVASHTCSLAVLKSSLRLVESLHGRHDANRLKKDRAESQRPRAHRRAGPQHPAAVRAE